MKHLIAEALRALAVVGLLATSAVPALADAAEPVDDIDGAKDNALVKRYEGSFIVSYERFSYTDFRVPLSPLKPSADPDARDKSNNRVYTPDKVVEVEGRSPASSMSCRPSVRRSRCCAITRMSLKRRKGRFSSNARRRSAAVPPPDRVQAVAAI